LHTVERSLDVKVAWLSVSHQSSRPWVFPPAIEVLLDGVGRSAPQVCPDAIDGDATAAEEHGVGGREDIGAREARATDARRAVGGSRRLWGFVLEVLLLRFKPLGHSADPVTSVHLR
jgi:hypothetical protein